MGAKSQRKGRNGEKELAAILCNHGYNVRPGAPLNYGKEADLAGLENIHIEVKRREHVDLAAALKQAAADAEKFGDGLPAVFHRGNRQSWRVTMALPDWLTLYQAAESGNNQKFMKKGE